MPNKRSDVLNAKRDRELNKFWKVARYTPINGHDVYSVKVGSKLLTNSDTQALFEQWLKAKGASNA